MDDDRLADLRRLVAARIPEMSPVEFEALAAPDPDALPTEVAARILEVVDAFADKLEAAVGAMQGKADQTLTELSDGRRNRAASRLCSPSWWPWGARWRLFGRSAFLEGRPEST